MKIAIIGRTEILYDTAMLLRNSGHEVTCILTAKEAPEYTRTAADFRRLADEWNVPFAQGARILDHADFLLASGSDIGVSINYTGIVPQEVIDIFPLGILNAHGGDLPRYRGNACQAWAILNGEERIGLCVHRMIGDEIDSGDIITRDYLPIDLSTKVTDTWRWMARRSPSLLLEAVEHLAIDPSYVLEPQSKVPADALRCYPRNSDDGRITWSSTAVDVLRLINASAQPYAGAYCLFREKPLIVWDARISPSSGVQYLAVPGQVTELGQGYVEVACGSGKLHLISIEYGGQIVTPDRILRSIRDRLV